MNQASLDILRQSGWDSWSWVCIAASLVLLAYAILGRIWTTAAGWIALALVLVGVCGTAIVTAVPALHQSLVGLLWTLVLMCLLSATFYLNLREQLGTRRMLILLFVRILALALLVPMLFEPVWRVITRQPPQRAISFLIDTSGSMSVNDVPNGPTRIQSIWQTLAPLLPNINDHFIPRFYSFSTHCSQLKSAQDLATIPADGKSTDFVTAINKAAADSATDKDAPFILISDGNDNVSPNVNDLIRQTRRKISTLSVGSAQTSPANLMNVAVEGVNAPPDASVGHESKLTAIIQSTALNNRVVDVNLAETDADGKPTGPVTSQRLVLQNVPGGQSVDLLYTPHTAGLHNLAVWIDPIPGERTVADNRQDIQLLAVEARIRVLYIEGALRSEYTYLYRMLGHDSDIELATLLRTQRDRVKAEGTVNGQPFGALPATDADWSQFDVIMIGDLDSSFLSPAAQTQITNRISSGAGLIMIGGEKNFGAGGYSGSPLEQALPVFVGGLSAAQDMEEFVPQLTPEGAAHPIFDQLTDWFPTASKPASQTLSALKGNVIVASPKAGAQILMVHKGQPGPDGHDQIVLAVEQYGKGRSAAFTADTTNVWFREFRQQGQASTFNRFWGQLIRWLAGQDARNRARGPGVQAVLNKSVYPFGESAKLRALVRDTTGDTTQYATVTATLTGSALDKPLQTTLNPSDLRVGQYESIFPSPGDPGLKPGDYTVDVTATKDTTTLGHQTLKFSVIPPEDEMQNIAASPQTMEDIATSTGGFHRPLAELPELLDTLIAADPLANQQTVQRTIPIANTVRAILSLTGNSTPWPPHSDLPMEGALVVTLLVGEWILRRKWQLP